MPDSDPIGRRRFLRRSIAVVPVATVLAAPAAGDAQTPSASSVVPTPTTQPGQNPQAYTPTFFSADEWAFVRAAVERLIPSDATGPGAIEAGVPEFIDRQMETPWGHGALWYMQAPFDPSASPLFGYQSKMPPRDLYRAAIAAVDGWCRQQPGGKRFVELDAGARDGVLKGLESGSIRLEGLSSRDFFAFLLQNTKEGYFSDPIHGGNKNAAAWSMIGFPGARADYLDWVQRPGVRYPLPPVTIAGPQG